MAVIAELSLGMRSEGLIWYTKVSGDIGRRLVPIELDAGVERPELRSVFKHRDLEAWVLRERRRLVVAALTILRAYVVAGRPTQKLSSFGSFEGWSDLVRSALTWIGAADPCIGRDRVRDESDGGLEELQSLVFHWISFLGERPWALLDAERSVRAAVERQGDDSQCEHARELLQIFLAKGKPAGGKVDVAALGNYLKKHKGRVVDGCRLVSVAKDQDPMRRAKWQIVRVRRDPEAGYTAPRHDPKPGPDEAFEGLTQCRIPTSATSVGTEAGYSAPLPLAENDLTQCRIPTVPKPPSKPMKAEGPLEDVPMGDGESGGCPRLGIRQRVMEGAVEDPDVSRDDEGPWPEGRE